MCQTSIIWFVATGTKRVVGSLGFIVHRRNALTLVKAFSNRLQAYCVSWFCTCEVRNHACVPFVLVGSISPRCSKVYFYLYLEVFQFCDKESPSAGTPSVHLRSCEQNFHYHYTARSRPSKTFLPTVSASTYTLTRSLSTLLPLSPVRKQNAIRHLHQLPLALHPLIPPLLPS